MRRTMRWRWPRRDEEQRLLYCFTECLPLALIGFGVSAFFVSFAYLSPFYILASLVTGIKVAVRNRQIRDTAIGGMTSGTRRRETSAAGSAYREGRTP
jgi:hypothetical protein